MPKTIGEILRRYRNERKLSIEDIAKATLIRAKYIEALEKDQFGSFPSAVHGKGFLRLYADYLEIPSKPLLDAWDNGLVEDFIDIHEELDQGQSQGFQTSDIADNDTLNEVAPLPQEQRKDDKSVGRREKAPISAEKPDLPLEEDTESAAIFSEIGGILREQRTLLGLTLNDIEQYTHIRLFFLQSIEAGRIGELPSPVQAKGMIESYAQFLDIDADTLMLKFAEGLQTQRVEKIQAPVTVSRKEKKFKKTEKQSLFRRLLTPDLLIGSFVIIVLVIFAIWSTSQVIARRNESVQSTIPGISDVLAATGSPTEEMLATTAPVNGTSGIETPTNLATPSSPASTPIIAEQNQGQTSQNQDTTPTLAFLDNAPLQVYIVARQRTYLRVLVDGETVFDGRITPGNAYPYSGNDSIEVLTGNAAALQIFFNQIDMGTIGAFGQVVDLLFTGQGVITPTPRFTPTSTQTIQASVTLQPTATPETPTVTPFIP